jgi:MoxR-like ATPase
VLGAKSRAILDGRMAASEEDVRALARNVLVHRVITNFRAESEGVTSAQIVQRLLETVKA